MSSSSSGSTTELMEKLDAKTAVSVLRIEHERKLFQGLKSRNVWTGFFRGSLAEFQPR